MECGSGSGETGCGSEIESASESETRGDAGLEKTNTHWRRELKKKWGQSTGANGSPYGVVKHMCHTHIEKRLRANVR